MQYRFALFALAGLAAAQSSSSSSAAAQSTNGVSPEETQCLSKCAAGDVNCQAQCVNVPFPNMAQANANTECAKNCPQGDGSPEQTKQFGECLAKCSNQHYYTSSGTLGADAGSSPTAAAVAGADSSSASGAGSMTTSASMSSGTGASMSSGSNTMTAAPSGASSASAGSSPSSTSSSHGAAAATMIPLGMMGVAMAVLAL